METTLRYKTGDPHPVYNLLAFVEYCDRGHEIWTSTFDDPSAPYRLARESAEFPRRCTCKSSRSEDNAESILRQEPEPQPLDLGGPLRRS